MTSDFSDPWGIRDEVSKWVPNAQLIDSDSIESYDDWASLVFELIGSLLGLPPNLRGKIYPIHDLSDMFFSRCSPRDASRQLTTQALAGEIGMFAEKDVEEFISFQLSLLYKPLLMIMAAGLMEHCCCRDLELKSTSGSQIVCFSVEFLEREFTSLMFGVERDKYTEWQASMAEDAERVKLHTLKSIELLTENYMFAIVERPTDADLDSICEALGLTTGIIRKFNPNVFWLNLTLEDCRYVATTTDRCKMIQDHQKDLFTNRLDAFRGVIQVGDPEGFTAMQTMAQIYGNFQQSDKASLLQSFRIEVASTPKTD